MYGQGSCRPSCHRWELFSKDSAYHNSGHVPYRTGDFAYFSAASALYQASHEVFGFSGADTLSSLMLTLPVLPRSVV